MALGIPLPGAPGESLLKGIDTGSMLFQRMIQPRLEREKQKQLDEHFKQELALRKQQESRLGANMGLQRQIMQQQLLHAQHANDPMYEFNQFKMLADMMGGGQQGQAQGQEMPSDLMGQGMGMFSPEGLQGAQSMGGQEQPSNNAPLMDALRKNPMLRGFFKHKFGYDPLAETNEDKRAKDFQSQVELEQIRNQQKIAFEQEKNNLADQNKRMATIEAAKNDTQHLETTLHSLEKMKEIAANPKNSDLFGHWIEGHETAAKRASNPNAGDWQVYGLDPIIAAEGKMSARGNQLALKAALNMKPNFAEKQQVALRKLEASIDLVKKAIEQNKKIAGQGGGSKSVIIIDPQGNRFETTEENAKFMPEGWSRG
jgi:hypothetical protein